MENQFCYLIYKTYLLENGVKEENIIEIKLDKMEFITFRNPFMLYKEITKTINKTPLDKYYLFIDEVQMAIEKKIEKATHLLRYSDKSLIDIANYLSFSSQSHFIKTFENFMGITPKKYRDKYYKSMW